MKKFDVVIIGAGLAGLQCAKSLAQEGAKILLVDRKEDLTKGIHTTGIFVRKTIEDFEFPAASLGKSINRVILHSPKLESLELKSEKDEFRIGRMGFLYKSILRECVDAGVHFMSGTRYVLAEVRPDTQTVINLKRQGEPFQLMTKVLIGADGARSRVATDLGLDENKQWIVGYEKIYQGVPVDDSPRLHCFLNAKLSPGYLAWITNDGEDCHVGVGGYPSRFDPRKALEIFETEIATKFVDFGKAKLSETRGGRIPVGGVLKKIANRNCLLIGDAAGAVSPLTAGGLDPCMRLSKFASEIVLKRLKTGNSNVLLNYSGEMFRAKFMTRLWMRHLLRAFSNQTLLELAFRLLQNKIGKRFAEKIFFRRGSFPDIKVTKLDGAMLPKIGQRKFRI